MRRTLIVLGLTLTVAGCSKQPSRTEAVPPPQQQTAQESRPEPDPPATREPSADNPDLDGVRVHVVEQGTVWNDVTQSVVRAIKATRESGDDIYFMCDTILQAANNKPVVINGKPFPNAACFAPKLHAVYTLHDTGGKDGWYFMWPPGDDGSDGWATKRPMVHYCPQCAPDR